MQRIAQNFHKIIPIAATLFVTTASCGRLHSKVKVICSYLPGHSFRTYARRGRRSCKSLLLRAREEGANTYEYILKMKTNRFFYMYSIMFSFARRFYFSIDESVSHTTSGVSKTIERSALSLFIYKSFGIVGQVLMN